MGVETSILYTEDCAEAMTMSVVVNLDANNVITPIEPMNSELVTLPETLFNRLVQIFRIASHQREKEVSILYSPRLPLSLLPSSFHLPTSLFASNMTTLIKIEGQ